MDAHVWKSAEMLVELLQPFSEPIHQLEGDKPYVADCHLLLISLRKFVEKWTAKHGEDGLKADDLCPSTVRAVPTMDR
jgi:hypothetical protein